MNTSTAARLGGFAVLAVAVFGGAYGIGAAVGPLGAAQDTAQGVQGEPGQHEPGGLRVTERGYTFAVDTTSFAEGQPKQFEFRITGPDGATVTAFDPNHDRRMHLIMARRDLSGYQHLHPAHGADGVWRVPAAFADAGEYRVFADFVPSALKRNLTLGAEVSVSGDSNPVPLPPPSDTARVDDSDHAVRLTGRPVVGEAKLVVSVSRGGAPVTDLQRYLGAYGHLVALREGDLGYLHVHPEESVTAGPDVVFSAAFPSAGRYRLYFDFQHGGVVRTAEFTVAVGDTGPSQPPAPTGPGDGHGHGH